MKKQNLVAFLIDKKNNWIEKYIKKIVDDKLLKKKYKFKKFYNLPNSPQGQILFILNYTKILKKKELNKFKLPIIIHGSKLPDYKGFAPVQNQILNNRNLIHFSMIKASLKVDSGDIIQRNFMKLNGSEIYDEIREKSANIIVKMIIKFLKNFPKYKLEKQKGYGKFYRKRKPDDQKLNINKSIKENFNTFRIANNEKWPAFFIYKKKKYIIKIYKDK